ncbi:MAG TPA: cytochrome c biogenesis heme-transporting ATPase CcmA [Casimicrobiaceae bacterium]|jgi:heme exporter protein A
MLRAERLAAQRGGVTLFANVEFALGSGEALVVTGANGSGKTTLLRMVAGLTQPTLGHLSWQGTPVAAFDHALRAATLYIGHAAALKDEFTAEENLLSLAALHGPAPDREVVQEALAEWSLGHHDDIPARVLSQGQRRRIALARMSLAQRRLWVLDEPATALDASGVATLEKRVNAHLAAQGIAVIATHQPLALAAGATRRLEL